MSKKNKIFRWDGKNNLQRNLELNDFQNRLNRVLDDCTKYKRKQQFFTINQDYFVFCETNFSYSSLSLSLSWPDESLELCLKIFFNNEIASRCKNAHLMNSIYLISSDDFNWFFSSSFEYIFCFFFG